MSELENANRKLLKRQTKPEPKAMADLVTAVQEMAFDGVPERLPKNEDIRQGRVIKRATLAELKIDNSILQAAVDMAHKWKDRKLAGFTDASIVLCGPVGTGKTHIARSVLWSISYSTAEGEPIAPAGRFFVASDLMLKLSPAKNDWGTNEVLRPATFIGNAPIVVIDDVGSEQAIPFVAADEQAAEIQARYFRVIDYCYQWRISLVITSNLSLSQLEAHVGARCWDRLCEMAPKGFMYDLTGVSSWRQKVSGR